jgi:hypothetical protein
MGAVGGGKAGPVDATARATGGVASQLVTTAAKGNGAGQGSKRDGRLGRSPNRPSLFCHLVDPTGGGDRYGGGACWMT